MTRTSRVRAIALLIIELVCILGGGQNSLRPSVEPGYMLSKKDWDTKDGNAMIYRKVHGKAIACRVSSAVIYGAKVWE